MLNYPDTAQLDFNASTLKENGEVAPSNFPDRHEGQGGVNRRPFVVCPTLYTHCLI